MGARARASIAALIVPETWHTNGWEANEYENENVKENVTQTQNENVATR